MIVVTPVDFEFVSTTAKDEDYPLWTKGLEVKAGSYYIYNESVYKAIKDFTSDLEPEADIANYVKFDVVNTKKFMDEIVGTSTISDDNLEIIIKPKNTFDMINFLNVDGGTIEINGISYSLLFKEIVSWWDYFFGATSFKRDFNVSFKGGTDQLTIKIKKGISGGTGLGKLILGKKNYLGNSLYGAEIGIIDYSKKTTDEWGNTILRKGKTAKNASITTIINTQDLDYTLRVLTSMAGKANVFICDDIDNGFEALTIYGFIKDFGITMDNYKKSELKINLEGLI